MADLEATLTKEELGSYAKQLANLLREAKLTANDAIMINIFMLFQISSDIKGVNIEEITLTKTEDGFQTVFAYDENTKVN